MWIDDWALAARANLAELADIYDGIGATDAAAGAHATFAELARKRRWRALALALRDDLPYRYDGPYAHQVTTWRGSHARGYAACADAAAEVAALLVWWGVQHVRLCVETFPREPHYAHARILVGATAIDPYPDRSWEVSACTTLVDVAALVTGPGT